MIAMSSTATQEKWGEVVRAAQREPIMVTSHGHESVVIISADEYRRLQLQALKAKVEVGMKQAERGEFSDASAEDIIRKGERMSGKTKADV